MSKYATGDVAKLCGVTVRTVQYYDARGILTPSTVTEGGRRLYSEEDVHRMKIICFLRDLGLSINAISQLFAEEDPGSVIFLLLEQQEQALKQEIGDREAQLRKLEQLKTGLREMKTVSVESIGDIAHIMTNRKKLRNIRLLMLLTAIPLGTLQWVSILLWIVKGIWWLFPMWVIAAIPYGIWVSRWYFRKVAYICPRCHTAFRPTFKESFWAAHTYATRKLTCPACGHRGFCVEIAAEPEEKNHE